MTSISKSRELSIHSTVFRWLYETSGCTRKEITDNTTITAEALSHHLNETEDTLIPLSLNTIKELAKLYHRPITAFLISTVPDETIIPKDFRRKRADGNPADLAQSQTTYSKELHQKFIKANRSLRLYTEMVENLNESLPQKLGYVTISHNPFEVAESERERLGIDNIQISRKDSEAYKQWREIFASNGIPVFQYNMVDDGVRGFTCRYKDSAAIVVNSGDTPTGRIFTILHEYAHILLGMDSVCTDEGNYDPIDDKAVEDISRIERWCDYFAGAFLVPEKKISENKTVISLINDLEYAKAAELLAKDFTVSKAAALVRLRVCEFVPPNAAATEFAKWRGETKKSSISEFTNQSESSDADDLEESDTELMGDEDANKNKTSVTKKGGVDRALQTLYELGEPYIRVANRNHDEGHISYTKYLNAIGISKNSDERLLKKGKGVVV